MTSTDTIDAALTWAFSSDGQRRIRVQQALDDARGSIARTQATVARMRKGRCWECGVAVTEEETTLVRIGGVLRELCEACEPRECDQCGEVLPEGCKRWCSRGCRAAAESDRS